jgi:hypothetical protein
LESAGKEKITLGHPGVELLGVLGWMVQWNGIDPTEMLEPTGDIEGVRKNSLRLEHQLSISPPDGMADLRAIRIVHEIATERLPKVIGGAVLVEDPEHFIGVRDEIGRKLEADQAIYRHPCTLGQVQ